MKTHQTISILFITLFVVSCANKPTTNTKSPGSLSQAPAEFPQVLDSGSSLPKTGQVNRKKLEKLKEILSPEEEIEQLTIDDVIKLEEPNTSNLYDNSRYDFPITLNSKVEQWIDYFTGRGRRHMERYLGRSAGYVSIMRQIFADEGLPSDLVFLCLIESGFNMRARSRVGATGAWQFMPATGKRYGLKIDFWIDERRDPIKSTRAAANYLKDLFLMFESWYLAAAAYNSGEYRVLRAIDRAKSNNYWYMSKRKFLPRETRNYVPKLIAAAIIGKNPKKFGFDNVNYAEPLSFETTSVPYPVYLKDIAKLVGVPHDTMLDLNPELLRGMIPPKHGPYEMRIPSGKKALVASAIIGKKKELNKPVMPVHYIVRRGDSLGKIARKFGVRQSALRDVNNIRNRHRIYPRQKLIIPSEVRPGRKYAEIRKPKKRAKKKKRAKARSKTNSKFKFHTVRRGESLWSIAEKYNVTVRSLFRWNGLRRSRIHPGKKLKVIPSTS